LVAAVKEGALEDSASWPIVVLRPGRAPLESLAVALAGLPGGAALIKDTRDLLNIQAFGDDAKSLHTFARLALRGDPRSRRLFLLVDQMEEVFTLCEDQAVRCAFFDNLRYAGTIGDGRMKKRLPTTARPSNCCQRSLRPTLTAGAPGTR
jgi:hypothetical protein